ncbi:GAP family protein [Mycobacterium sp. OTB74]|jgi:cytochrome c biogenesis protein CcdA|uniref:GAP family protein n=1 Tax=Mycobacterium sp. OTB74 TaxID=1853452 RepID=UPI0024743D4A|nr:GAP family protein [Mycobacterium sp. OTB74]MDH6247232.1 cytochrome c biogenesis protein CcdA [Mycobacterium sp. OTB74]
MTALLLTLAGLAFLDSLSVLNIGVVSVVVYGSRLNRQSALPGGVSFIAGVFAVTTTFGMCAVLGLHLLTDLTNFNLTPAVRYWGELLLGLVLIALAFFPLVAQSTAPGWAMGAMRERPWLLGFVGAAVGLGQASTAVPYLAGLAMIAALQPRPPEWPLIVIAYCFIALLPCMLVLALSTSRSKRADRAQRWLVRTLTRYGPIGVRVLFLIAGVALCADAIVHRSRWW